MAKPNLAFSFFKIMEWKKKLFLFQRAFSFPSQKSPAFLQVLFYRGFTISPYFAQYYLFAPFKQPQSSLFFWIFYETSRNFQIFYYFLEITIIFLLSIPKPIKCKLIKAIVHSKSQLLWRNGFLWHRKIKLFVKK